MDPITMALMFGGMGLGKSFLVDQPKEARQRKLAAETQRYSPWTGLQAGAINEADPFGATLQGAASGASFGQNMEQNNSDLESKKLYQDWMRSRTPQAKIAPAGSMDAYNQQFSPWGSY
jgi:hypothetical protein